MKRKNKRKIKLLILGHNGYLGKKLLPVFKEDDKFEVITLDYKLTPFFLYSDLKEISPNVILNLAWDGTYGQKTTNLELQNYNKKLQKTLSEWVLDFDSKLYNIGDIKEFLKPQTAYSNKKRELRQEYRDYSENIVNIRLGDVIDVNNPHSFINDLISQISENKEIVESEYNLEEVVLSPVSIDEVVEKISNIVSRNWKGLHIIANDELVKAHDYLEQKKAELNSDSTIVSGTKLYEYFNEQEVVNRKFN